MPFISCSVMIRTNLREVPCGHKNNSLALLKNYVGLFVHVYRSDCTSKPSQLVSSCKWLAYSVSNYVLKSLQVIKLNLISCLQKGVSALVEAAHIPHKERGDYLLEIELKCRLTSSHNRPVRSKRTSGVGSNSNRTYWHWHLWRRQCGWFEATW